MIRVVYQHSPASLMGANFHTSNCSMAEMSSKAIGVQDENENIARSCKIVCRVVHHGHFQHKFRCHQSRFIVVCEIPKKRQRREQWKPVKADAMCYRVSGLR